METEIVRGDIQTVGNNFKQMAESSSRIAIRELWKLIKKLFKITTSAVYRNRIAGLKRINIDGRTKEKDKISGLTYDEMQNVAVKYREEEVPFIIIEENDKTLGDKKTLASINKFTETKYLLEKAKKRLDKKPNSIRRVKRVEKLQNEYDKLLEKKKGKTYTIMTNKSRTDFNNERRIEIVEQRTQFTRSKFEQEFVKDNGKAKVYDEARFNDFLQKVKAEGKLVELNQDQLAAMFSSLHKDGTVDVSKFENNYYVHTVDAENGGRIVNALENEGIEFAVEEGTVDDDEVIKVYINEDDMHFYNAHGFSKQGTIQHYGDGKSKKESTSPLPLSEHTIIIPENKINETNRLLKDEEYKFEYGVNEKGERVGFFTVTEEASQRAYEKELHSNAVREDLENAKQKEAVKTQTILPVHEVDKTVENKGISISNSEISKDNIDPDLELDIDIDDIEKDN